MAVELIDQPGELSDANREMLGTIQRNVEIETNLIDDLLDVTRLCNGKLEISREAADLHHILREVIDIGQHEINDRCQRLEIHLDATECRLSADSSRLRQAFLNLLKNASKFTPERGRITLRSSNEAGKILVEISDTGIGLDPDALARIFRPFEQGSPLVTRRHGGLGLGLTLSKAILESHSGTLKAASEGVDKGATFIAELPL